MGVVPGRQHLSIEARLRALAVPADAEAVAVGRALGLGGAEALLHQRVRRLADQLVEKHRGTGIGQPAAHGILKERPCDGRGRSEEHTSELQSLMRISYAVFCLKKKNTQHHSSETKIAHLNTINTH